MTAFYPPAKPGEQHHLAKLTAAQVLAIRADPRQGKQIAPEYGVSPQTISKIRRRLLWKHL